MPIDAFLVSNSYFFFFFKVKFDVPKNSCLNLNQTCNRKWWNWYIIKAFCNSILCHLTMAASQRHCIKYHYRILWYLNCNNVFAFYFHQSATFFSQLVKNKLNSSNLKKLPGNIWNVCEIDRDNPVLSSCSLLFGNYER